MFWQKFLLEVDKAYGAQRRGSLEESADLKDYRLRDHKDTELCGSK